MSKILPEALTQRGLIPHHLGTPAVIPFQTWIGCDYFDQQFDLIDVAPWGTVIPADVLEHKGSIFFDVVVDTRGMPAGTELAVRWTPADGSDIHTLRRTLNGDEETMRLRLHWSLIEQAEGQNVLIQADALPPGGNPYPGRSFSVRVKNRLVPGEINLADFADGDLLDPGEYPDGISGSIESIGNIEGYNTLTVGWSLYGIDGDHGLELLYQWETEFPGTPDQPYTFKVPAEAYTGFEDSRFDKIVGVISATTRLTPWPNQPMMYSLGGISLELPTSTRE